jgi:hypothetical protein
MGLLPHIQMCDRTVFHTRLEIFVAMNRGHRFDEVERHCGGNGAEEKKGKSRTVEESFVSQSIYLSFQGSTEEMRT